MKNCKQCGKRFEPKSKSQIFCIKACRDKNIKEIKGEVKNVERKKAIEDNKEWIRDFNNRCRDRVNA